MKNTVAVGLLVVAMLLVVAGYGSKESTAQAQAGGAGATTRPKELVLDLGDKVTLKLVEIPAGKFMMGSPRDEKDRRDNEGLPPGKRVDGNPQIEVTISKPFYLGVHEVTVAQYAQFVKDSGTPHQKPSLVRTGDHPVVNVSWHDAEAFCWWLSKRTGKTVVLPTEAQWEYACRAGTRTRYSFGDDEKKLGDYAWTKVNSGRKTQPVGRKKPNDYGLYDMHGNVQEWCADAYADSYAGSAVDPTGPIPGVGERLRVARGGSVGEGPEFCRSASRGWHLEGRRAVIHGFRVAVVSAGADVP